MAGSRKSSLINTIFKSLALAQPAVINHTGRESPTSRPETGGFFTFTKCRARCKIHFKRSSISLIFLGIIIVNTLTHRSSLRGGYIWIRLWSPMFVIKISETCFQSVSSFRVTNHNLHGLILDWTERSIVRDFKLLICTHPIPLEFSILLSELSCAISCKPFRHSPPVFLEKWRSRFVVELTVFIESTVSQGRKDAKTEKDPSF